METKIIRITGFNTLLPCTLGEGYWLIKEIQIVSTATEGHFIAEEANSILGLWGDGETFDEAIEDFKLELMDFYDAIIGVPDEYLSAEFLLRKDTIMGMIQKEDD